jgi:hypothetical protein
MGQGHRRARPADAARNRALTVQVHSHHGSLRPHPGQMLVEITSHEPFAQRAAIEEGLPVAPLGLHLGRRPAPARRVRAGRAPCESTRSAPSSRLRRGRISDALCETSSAFSPSTGQKLLSPVCLFGRAAGCRVRSPTNCISSVRAPDRRRPPRGRSLWRGSRRRCGHRCRAGWGRRSSAASGRRHSGWWRCAPNPNNFASRAGRGRRPKFRIFWPIAFLRRRP